MPPVAVLLPHSGGHLLIGPHPNIQSRRGCCFCPQEVSCCLVFDFYVFCRKQEQGVSSLVPQQVHSAAGVSCGFHCALARETASAQLMLTNFPKEAVRGGSCVARACSSQCATTSRQPREAPHLLCCVALFDGVAGSGRAREKFLLMGGSSELVLPFLGQASVFGGQKDSCCSSLMMRHDAVVLGRATLECGAALGVTCVQQADGRRGELAKWAGFWAQLLRFPNSPPPPPSNTTRRSITRRVAHLENAAVETEGLSSIKFDIVPLRLRWLLEQCPVACFEGALPPFPLQISCWRHHRFCGVEEQSQLTCCWCVGCPELSTAWSKQRRDSR